jgi:hypothetical protein
MFGLTLKQFQRGFFDRNAVKNAMDRATHDVLSRFGAFVRQTAQVSMKKAPAPQRKPLLDRKTGKPVRDASGKIRIVLKYRYSDPGSPPFYRSGLIRHHRQSGIKFAFDLKTRSVVIGPSKLPGWPNSKAPELHEHGGTVAFTGKSGKRRVHRYPPRPFMRPAFDKELKTLPSLWQNSVKP